MSSIETIPCEPVHAPGIGRLLTVATFQATRTKRMDLITDSTAGAFYESFTHKKMAGYRIYPGG